MNKPVLAMSYHDPDGILYNHLNLIRTELINYYDGIFLSVTPITEQKQRIILNKLRKDKNINLIFNQKDSQIGDHHCSAYRAAINASSAETNIHLCTLDRLIYILLSQYHNNFWKDIIKFNKSKKPVMFTRSTKAWMTHPVTYYAAESVLTSAGKILFNRELDFVWCYLIINSKLLKNILVRNNFRDLRVYTQIVLNIRDIVKTQAVDWLAWEDPFIFDQDPDKLRKKCDNDIKEIEKRVNYVVPILRLIFESQINHK